MNEHTRRLTVLIACLVVIGGTMGAASVGGVSVLERGQSVAIDGTVGVSIDEAGGNHGDVVSVDLGSNAAIAGADVTVTYDSAVVSFVGASDGDLGNVEVNDETPGEVVLTSSSATNVEEPLITTLEFELIGEPGSATVIAFDDAGTSVYDEATGEITIDEYTDGSVVITDEEDVESANISIASTEGSVGDVVAVSLDTDGAIAGAEAMIYYDPDVVSFSGASDGDLGNVEVNDETPGEVVLTSSSATNVEEPLIATLEFELIGEPGSATALSFVTAETALFDEEAGEIEVDTYDDGNVTIEADDDDGDDPEPVEANVSIAEASGEAGDVVTVDLDSDGTIAGADVTITYDPDVVSFGGASDGDLGNVEVNDETPGEVALTSSSATNVEEPLIATLEFELIGEPGSATALSFVTAETALFDEEAGEIEVDTYDDGNVTIEADDDPEPVEANVSIAEASGEAGDVVTVDLDSDGEIAGADVTITYDPDVVSFGGASDGDLGGVVVNDETVGEIALTASSATNVEEPLIATLEFELDGEPGSETALSFVASETNLNDEEGHVEIESFDDGHLVIEADDDDGGGVPPPPPPPGDDDDEDDQDGSDEPSDEMDDDLEPDRVTDDDEDIDADSINVTPTTNTSTTYDDRTPTFDPDDEETPGFGGAVTLVAILLGVAGLYARRRE